METPARSLGVVGAYGRAAVRATQLLRSTPSLSPRAAWNSAVLKEFPDSSSSRKKGCPRAAFLGLCQEGYVNVVDRGDYTRSLKNRQYAVNAAHLLDAEPSITAGELWLKATKGQKVSHNGQMDVVISLWNEGFLTFP